MDTESCIVCICILQDVCVYRRKLKNSKTETDKPELGGGGGDRKVLFISFCYILYDEISKLCYIYYVCVVLYVFPSHNTTTHTATQNNTFTQQQNNKTRFSLLYDVFSSLKKKGGGGEEKIDR